MSCYEKQLYSFEIVHSTWENSANQMPMHSTDLGAIIPIYLQTQHYSTWHHYFVVKTYKLLLSQ